MFYYYYTVLDPLHAHIHTHTFHYGINTTYNKIIINAFVLTFYRQIVTMD